MLTIAKLSSGICRIIPETFAESWDQIGLQIGDPDHPVNRVVLTLDLTTAAISYAKTVGAELIICHHPPIFQPLSSLRLDRVNEALLYDLVKSDLSVLALHTNLDSVPGGVADQFARLLDLSEIQTLVPLDAGQIASASLSDSLWGRLFLVTPGFGRTGNLPEPIMISALVRLLRERLATPNLLIAAVDDHLITRVTVCPGSFDDDWTALVLEQGCAVLVCGEIKYHSQLALVSAGIAVITVGHDVSERVVLQPLADLLAGMYPEIAFAVCPAFDYNKVAF
jgi:dinuclear metal center YbgI/SA1388 family protein